MKKYKCVFYVSILASFLLMGCSKEDNGNGNTNPTNNPGGVSVPDGKGVLAAVKTVTFTEVPGYGVTEVVFNTGTAAFWESSPTSFVNAGDVSLNDVALTFQAESKVYIPNATAIIELPPIVWKVTGGNGIPGFTKEITSGFPDFTGTLPGTVSANEDLVISLSGKVSNADSVFVGVFGDTKSKWQMVSKNTASVTFSKSDLSSLGTIRQVQVTPIKYLPETINGNKFWFVLEEGNTRTYNLMP